MASLVDRTEPGRKFTNKATEKIATEINCPVIREEISYKWIWISMQWPGGLRAGPGRA